MNERIQSRSQRLGQPHLPSLGRFQRAKTPRIFTALPNWRIAIALRSCCFLVMGFTLAPATLCLGSIGTAASRDGSQWRPV